MPENPKSINVLCIDDDRNRDTIYQRFFDLYNADSSRSYQVQLRVASDVNDGIRNLRGRFPNLVIMDVLLKRSWPEHGVEELVSTLVDSRIPVAFVSGDMGQSEAVRQIRQHMSALKDSRKVGFFTFFDSFEKHIASQESCLDSPPQALPLEVLSLWNIILMDALGVHPTNWSGTGRTKHTFFHLTDTHFGAVKSDSIWIESLANLVVSNSINIDALIWTGDVANRGLPSEYRSAEAFVHMLQSKGILSSSCPIFVVSGNHDHCWPLALATNVDADPNSKGKWVILDKPNPALADLRRYRVQPFSDFYERLTGRKTDVFEKGFSWNTDFSIEGFIFLELSIESFTVDGFDSPGRTDLNEIYGRVFDEFRILESQGLKDDCVIFVLIHGNDPTPQLQIQFNSFADAMAKKSYSLIILGGHYHVDDVRPRDSILHVVGCPIFSEVTSGSAVLPGFPFITISRGSNGEAICDIDIYKFERTLDGSFRPLDVCQYKYRQRTDSRKFRTFWIEY